MKVTVEISNFSDTTTIKVHNAWYFSNERVDLEVDGKRYTVDAKELKSAIDRCLTDSLGY